MDKKKDQLLEEVSKLHSEYEDETGQRGDDKEIRLKIWRIHVF